MTIFNPTEGKKVAEVLKSVLQAEKETGFPTIGRIPSTGAKRFIKYVNQLPEEQWKILSETFSKRGSSLLIRSNERFPMVEIQAAFSEIEKKELESYHRASLSAGGDVQLMPLRLMKMAVGADKRARTPEQFKSLPESIQKIDETEAAKASSLRKFLKSAMTALGFMGTNIGGGNWNYSKSDERFTYRLSLDFGGRTDQLRYHVHLRSKRGPKLMYLSLESIFGFGHGHWDYIVVNEAENSMQLFVEIVKEMINLPESFSNVSDFGLS